MAKRSNPFIEDFVQQSKVHVGIKQFNNNEDRLKKVYEKTLHLLFKGAKKPFQDLSIAPDDVSLSRKDNMKQLVIGKDGTLLHTAVLQVEDNIVSIKHCVCGSPAVDNRCAYCETALCSSCQHVCERCHRPHCTICSLYRSEGSKVCVSCYG